ncbi:MAG: hypothetical protein KC583_15505, partial [Myxococcales bacterium]|nr:hypothetical protein [Myxococcales bacterium]
EPSNRAVVVDEKKVPADVGLRALGAGGATALPRIATPQAPFEAPTFEAPPEAKPRPPSDAPVKAAAARSQLAAVVEEDEESSDGDIDFDDDRTLDVDRRDEARRLSGKKDKAKEAFAGKAEDEAGERERQRRAVKKRSALEGLRRELADGGEVLDGTPDVVPDDAIAALRHVRPDRFLPRMCYFENTYLGGNAAYEERLRRLDEDFGRDAPYRLASLPPQPFDAPADAGLSLTAALDTRSLDQPGRVYLQIGLQGSKRYGWRRPPLDVALVVDPAARRADAAALEQAVTTLVRRLGPQDRLAVVLAAEDGAEVLAPLAGVRDQRLALARQLEGLPAPEGAGGEALGRAMDTAGQVLRRGADDQARVPGTQTVVLLTHGADAERVQSAAHAAHALSVQGAVTSVVQTGGDRGAWWSVANAGHGNYHRGEVQASLEAELESLSKIIARLLRVNVRLASKVEGVRVIGSRVLGQDEVKRVKAREEATDRNLSRTLGVTADRGDDDDGIQTVIPYFYGGDAHVILLELWVESPGAVADVTLKYKDMVSLTNATARDSVALTRLPREDTPLQHIVRRNVRGFRLAEALEGAAALVERGQRPPAFALLERARAQLPAADRRLLDAFDRARGLPDHRLAAALRMASARRVGQPARGASARLVER